MSSPTRSIVAGVLLWSSLALSLHSQAPAVPPAPGDPFVKDAAGANANKQAPWQNCLVVLETYSLDKNEAHAVLEAERGGAARYRRVLDLNKAGKARLETLTALTTRSGQRAVVEAIDEVRYPTQFHPPATRNGLATPTAWETRNVGDTLEFEPVIGPDRRLCDLNLVPQHVTLVGFKDVGGMADDSPISQPFFDCQKIVTSLGVSDNEVAYLGTITSPTAQGIANGEGSSEIWLAFIHVHLVGPTADEMKPPAKDLPFYGLNLEYSCFSLDREQARELLASATTLGAPWEKMQTLLTAKKARLEHVSTIVTKSGQRAVTEEVHEIRFATEYSPESPVSSTETTTRTVTVKPSARETADGTTTSERITTNHTDANAERRPGYASAFETRNAGITVEVEPVVSEDAVTVDVNHVVQSVSDRGTLQTTGVATRYPAQRLFETRKVTTSESLVVGRNILVGTFNPPGNDGVNGRKDDGRTWLLFVRAHNGQ